MGVNSAGSLVTPSIVIGGEGWRLAQPPKTATISETGEERSIHSQRNSYQSQHRDPYMVEGELPSPARSEASTLSLYSAQGRAQFAKHGVDTVIDLVIKEEKWSDGANDEEDAYPGVIPYLDTVFSELFDYVLR